MQQIPSAGKRKPRNARAVVMEDILGRVRAGVPLLPGHAAPLNATEPVQVICARSAYLHTGQQPYQAALEGLIHDRTRSRGRAAQNLLARMGASIHGIWMRS